RLSSGQPQQDQNTSMDSGVSDRDKTLLTDGSKSRKIKKENTSTDARTVVDPSYSNSKAYEAPKQEPANRKVEPEKPKSASIYGSGRKRLIIRGAILVGALILILLVLFGGGGTKNAERTLPDYIEFPETKTDNATEPAAEKPQTPTTPQQQAQVPPQAQEQEPVNVQEPAPSIINTKASLMITSTPESALYIDGEYKGKTPLDLKELDINRKYQIELKLDGYNTISKFFTLRKAGSNRLDFGLSPQLNSGKSHLSLEIQPPVKIYIDGVLVSNFRSLYMYEIQPGEHTVRLLNDKAEIDTTIQVNVPKGEHVKKDITLR
ncbi:MAG TPA: PEGA domain-containing protein, partial [bacterium]|nr:PEGA domain-containing protein [bacterium]